MVLSQLQRRYPLAQGHPTIAGARGLGILAAPAGLVAAILVALVIRLATIGTQSAWLDEGYSMAVAHHGMGYILFFIAHNDVHPPLYYLLLHLWLAATGDGLGQARLLSALCGSAAVPVVYVLATELFDRRTGACAALLLAVSPLASWYSDEARMYAMAELFALLAFASLARAVRRDSRAAWASYVVCAALAFYTDYSAAYVLAGTTICALLARPGTPTTPWPRLIGALAPAILALPALALLRWQAAHNLSSVAWIPAPTPGGVGAVLIDLIALHTALPAAVAVAGLALAGLGLLAVSADYRRPQLRWSYLLLASIFLAPLLLALALSAGHSVFLTRTVMASAYGLTIFFARGLAAWAPRRLVWSLLALAPLLAVDGASLNAAYATTINEDWRGAAVYLSEQALPGDVIVFGQGYLQLPFDVYWNRYNLRNAQRGYPYDEGLLKDHPGDLTTDRALAQATSGARTVWFIARDADAGADPTGPAGSWLRARRRLVGTRAFTGVTVYRLMTLPIASGASAASASWLDAAGVTLHHVAPHDLVLVRGEGADAFVRLWGAYPHPPARLVRLRGREEGRDLAAALDPHARAIWLATTTTAPGDPAGVAGGWLYRQGPQAGVAQMFGQIRLYRFAHGWTKE